MHTNDDKLPDSKPPIPASGWQAQLNLGFTKNTERTIMKHCRHNGPLRVQRPFYPENQGTCHVYILHPPGGIVAGDSLDIKISVDRATDTLITTPAANKFYRSQHLDALQSHTIHIERGACFEWLPQETIVFDGARVKSNTRIELANTASLIGWDIVCLGRPASNESYSHGYFKQHIEIWREGKPLFIDRCLHVGGSDALKSQWGMASRPVTGSLFCTASSNTAESTNTTDLVNKLRDTIKSDTNCLFSISVINSIIICRYLGEHIEQAKALFIQAWSQLRPALLNKEPVIPRIWNT